MSNYDSVDFFTDESLIEDPYPYFEHLRSKCPVLPTPHYGVVAVSGYEEATEIYRNIDTFSSCNSVIGPFATFPVPLEGDDVGAIIDGYRDQLPMNEHMVTMDPPMHTQGAGADDAAAHPEAAQGERGVHVARRRPAARRVRRRRPLRVHQRLYAALRHAGGRRRARRARGGSPRFRQGFGLAATPGGISASGQDGDDDEDQRPSTCSTGSTTGSPAYIEDRRRDPRHDVLTDLALATYPDGSTPEVTSVVRTATFLFAAGQETTARLLAIGLKYLAEYPELQDELRAHRDRIPDFIEEALRIESPVKADFRLARRATTVGGVDIAPGTPVMLLNGAANRDPRRFECPAEFRLDRPNAKEHIAFGRGAHSCPGGPLARVEGRVSIERILDRMRDIRLSEEHHGPPGDRHFDYEPTWVLRGLHELHIEFTPTGGRRDERPSGRRDRGGLGHRPRRRPAAGGGRPCRGAARPRRPGHGAGRR